MEKQQDSPPDSLSTVTVKDNSCYPPSEVYSSEPPPAYQKPRSTAVQIARIVSVAVVLVSFVLGSFILAASWVQAHASCQVQSTHLFTQHEVPADDHPSFQHLVDPLQSEESTDNGKQEAVPPPQHTDAAHQPVHIKLPLQLDFDELAGSMMEKNQRSRMNCVVEKRRAEQIVDHQPKTVRLPFGVNITTDPRYEHVSGEKMVIHCESGNDQVNVPMDMMATPIVVPLPGQVHLPLQQSHNKMAAVRNHAAPVKQQHASVPAHLAGHRSGIAMPIPVHADIQVTESRQQPVQIPIHVEEVRQGRSFQHSPQIHQIQQIQQIPIQVLEAREQVQIPIHITEIREGRVFQHKGQQIPIQVQEERKDIPLFHHAVQQIPIEITEIREGRAFQQQPISVPIQMSEIREGRAFQQQPISVPIQLREMREGRDMQVQHERAESRSLHPHADMMRPPMQRLPFQRLPVNVPVPLMQEVAEEQPRPHYVQPRSVRSVDDVLHRREKRVRRCACDCAC